MTELDPNTELTLELALLSEQPSAADKARNLAALRGRLARPLPGADESAEASGGSSERSGAKAGSALGAERSPSPGGAGRPLLSVRAPLVQLASVGIVAATLGFLAGLRAGSVALPSGAERDGASALLPAGAPTAARSASAPATSSASPAPDAASPDAPSSLKWQARDRSRPRASASTLATKDSRAPARARPESSPEFLRAVQLLRRARAAIQKGEATLSSSLLDELDAQFPPELLDEERAATRVLALCASDPTDANREASRLAERLLQRYPRSIYAPRLSQSCARLHLSKGDE